PASVKVSVADSEVHIEGAKGKLSYKLPPAVTVKIDSTARRLQVVRQGDGQEQRALHGLTRALIRNMVQGVAEGYEKKLDIVGVGYQAKVEGKTLRLQVGFAHPVLKPIPVGLVVETPSAVKIIIRGPDRQMVGQFAAEVRKVRPPEPYNGKG